MNKKESILYYISHILIIYGLLKLIFLILGLIGLFLCNEKIYSYIFYSQNILILILLIIYIFFAKSDDILLNYIYALKIVTMLVMTIPLLTIILRLIYTKTEITLQNNPFPQPTNSQEALIDIVLLCSILIIISFHKNMTWLKILSVIIFLSYYSIIPLYYSVNIQLKILDQNISLCLIGLIHDLLIIICYPIIGFYINKNKSYNN